MENFRIYETIDSTNLEAARLLSSGQPLHGVLLIAKSQSDGRGQYGRTWHAQNGNHLAMSIILQPANMSTAELPYLAMKVSLAIVEVLSMIDPPLQARIKWPNDIYINNKKIAGILIENLLSAYRVQHSIIGIGMNVNETNFPVEIPNAVSLFMITNRKYDVKEIAGSIKNHIMKLLDQTIETWKPEYDKHIYGIAFPNAFDINGKIHLAVVQGVDLEGKIVLQMENGKIRSYFSHEIKWILE